MSRVRLGQDEYAVVSVEPARWQARAGLTETEREVVALALSGRSNAEIASERGTSARTVANQLASVFRKLKVGSRAELARVCARLDED